MDEKEKEFNEKIRDVLDLFKGYETDLYEAEPTLSGREVFEPLINEMLKNKPSNNKYPISVDTDFLNQDTRKKMHKIKQKADKEQKISDMIQGFPSETILKGLLMKLGRSPKTEKFYKNVLDYMHRHSFSVFVEENMSLEEEKIESTVDDWLDTMAHAIKRIPGVKRITSIQEDYPDIVSIIINLDMSSFEDDEVNEYMNMIHETVEKFKPNSLKELEVIFNSKVVY